MKQLGNNAGSEAGIEEGGNYAGNSAVEEDCGDFTIHLILG